jgi:carboxypeptidase Taq
MQAYTELTKRFTQLHHFQHMGAMLQWDMAALMPKKGGAARAAATTELDLHTHALITDAALSALFATAAAEDAAGALGALEQANLLEMRKAWELETKLPADLVARTATVHAEANQAWVDMRKANDWAGFVPHLSKVVALAKEKGALLAAGNEMTAYEALMQNYEYGVSKATVDGVFADMKTWLPGMVKEALAKRAGATPLPLTGPYPTDKQRELGLEVMKLMNFDFDAGRLDVAPHPFCGGVPEDVRLTTRYDEGDFSQALMGIVHETGHAMYEQNRPRDCITQPVSQARSMGIHESQSLFAEMHIGRSAAFVELLHPLAVKHLGAADNLTLANLQQTYNNVAPGLIRVDADELTYPLHVLLRYEIEVALIDGDLAVADVPAQWDAKMQQYLGLDTAGNHKDGAMQDIHWSMGYVGYFPTYALGAMYAAQWMAAVRKELGDAEVDAMIRAGELGAIQAWQREHIWSKGSLLSTDELLTKGTGETLNVEHYKAHLKKRYL